MIEFAAAYSAVSTALDISKGLLAARTQSDINQVAIELQSSIIDLQSKLSGIQADYEQLARIKQETEQKLAAYEKWEEESSHYQLKNLGADILVYEFCYTPTGGKPPHRICPNCYEDRKKSILQRPALNAPHLQCTRCNFNVILDELA